MAKKTLDELTERASNPTIKKMAKQRLRLLEKFEAELVAFLIDCENDLPFNPSERCRAFVFWFASQKVSEGGDVDHIKRKLEMGDGMMRSECIHILADETIPEKLKKLLEEHLRRISTLENRSSKTAGRTALRNP